MFDNIPGVRVISEPWCFSGLHHLYRRKLISRPQFENLIEASFKLLLKPTVTEGYKRVVIKMTPYTMGMAPIFEKLMPNIKQVFMTRGLKGSITVRLK